MATVQPRGLASRSCVGRRRSCAQQREAEDLGSVLPHTAAPWVHTPTSALDLPWICPVLPAISLAQGSTIFFLPVQWTSPQIDLFLYLIHLVFWNSSTKSIQTTTTKTKPINLTLTPTSTSYALLSTRLKLLSTEGECPGKTLRTYIAVLTV